MWDSKLINRFILTLIRNNSVYKVKFYYLIRCLLMIQILSVVFPPKAIEKLPWNYDKFYIISDSVGTISRLNYFISFFSSSSDAIYIFLITLGFLMGLEIYILYKLHNSIPDWNESFIDATKIINKNVLKAEGIARLLILDLAYIPSILFMRDFICGSTAPLHSFIPFIVWGTLFFIFSNLNSILLRTPDWTRNNIDLISDVKYILGKKIGLAAVIISSYFIPYSSSPYPYSVVRIIYGVVSLKIFYRTQPYASLGINFVECVESLIILVAGIIFSLVNLLDINESNYLATTLSFLMVQPLLAIVAYDLVKKHRSALLSSSLAPKDNTFFLCLYTRLMQSKLSGSYKIEEDIEYMITERLNESNNESWVIIWLFEYFVSMRYFIGANIMLSRTIPDNAGVIKRVSMSLNNGYLAYFKEKLMKEIHDHSGLEWEAHSYMRMKYNFFMLCEEDALCCEYYWKIYHELGKGVQTSSSLSSLMIRFNNQIERTKNYYRTLLRDYSKNSELLEFYAGFLETVCCSKKADDIHMNARKYKEDEKFQAEMREDELNYFNRNYIKFSLNLSSSHPGIIMWAQKSENLGFDDKLLKHTSFIDLVPYGLKESYIEYISRVTTLFEPIDMLYSNYKSYIYTSTHFIRAVYIKFNLTHTIDNKLELLVNIKTNPNGSEVAIMDKEGRKILSMVTYI